MPGGPFLSRADLDSRATDRYAACGNLLWLRGARAAAGSGSATSPAAVATPARSERAEILLGFDDEAVLVLLGELSRGADDIIDERQVHRLRIEFELAGFDLRQVQYLVVRNRDWLYGSPYSPDSINNEFGLFGSPYSPFSATNEFAIGRGPRRR